MDRGGWIPIVKQRGGQGSRREDNHPGIHTLFVDNLPRSMDPKGMYNLFKKFGVVNDVFIPQKRRRFTASRFGFVRFGCQVAASVAVKKANGLWVDDKVLVVKSADFGRGKQKKGYTNPQGKSQGVQRPQLRDSGKGMNQFVGQRSYVQVVKGENTGGVGAVTVNAEEVGNGWLYESLILRLKAKYASVNMEMELEARGMKEVVVRKGGGRDLILTFNSKEEMKSKMKDVKEMFGDWCEEVVTGEAGKVLEQERCVWLSCYGIPLNLWNRTNLHRIGNLWGEILCTEGELSQPLLFNCGKMKISTKYMEPINKLINMECKGVLYPVRVCEEQRVVVQTIKETCVCKKHMHLDDVYSANEQVGKSMEVRSKDGEDEDDWAAESAKVLGRNDGMGTGDMPNGPVNRTEVEQEVHGRSETVVAASSERLG
ncbi:hypothetical protein ACSBR1_002073 [Camellia fascicularis]